MDRNEFMKSLEQHYPDDMNDEQLDALEQFSFKLFDAGYAEDKVDILLANEGLNKLLTSNHDEHKARFLKLSELKQRNAELVAQVEYFKNGMAELQDYIDKIEPQHAIVKSALVAADDILSGHRKYPELPEYEFIKSTIKTPAQCLAEHNREVAAKAVEKAADELSSLMTAPAGMHTAAIIKLNLYANKIKSGEVEV